MWRYQSDMLISKLTTKVLQLTVALSEMTTAPPAVPSSFTLLSAIPGPIAEPRVETLEQGWPIQSYESPYPAGFPSYRVDNSFHIASGRQCTAWRWLPQGGEPEPMQVGRTRLRPEEWLHFPQENLCQHCGEVGHVFSHCPAKALACQ